MAQDIEQMLREVFGDSINKISQFQGAQWTKLTGRIQEIAREGMADEIARLSTEIAELKKRVVELEAERAENAAESI